MTKSETVNVIPVHIANKSGSGMLHINFVPTSQRSNTFQPVVAGLLHVPDDGKGLRDDKPDTTGAREIVIELHIFIAPAGQRVTTLNAHGGFGGVHFDPDTYQMAYHTLTRRLKLRLPPPIIEVK